MEIKTIWLIDWEYTGMVIPLFDFRPYCHALNNLTQIQQVHLNRQL